MKNLFFFLLWITTASYSFAQTATNQPLLDLFENMDMTRWHHLFRLAIKKPTLQSVSRPIYIIGSPLSTLIHT